MGVVIEDLEDHEGYAARRLLDGTLTGTWTWATREFDAYVGACSCGWRANLNYLPTEAGEQAALDHWYQGHATPLLERQTQQRRAELAQALRALGGLADFLAHPANLAWIGRAADRARELVDDLQRDQERRRLEREASDERC
jgi:hypothetical protein